MDAAPARGRSPTACLQRISQGPDARSPLRAQGQHRRTRRLAQPPRRIRTEIAMTNIIARALIQFIWEGALIALLLAVFLLVARRASSRLRYAAATFALAAMPIVFCANFAQSTTRTVL